MSWLDVVGSGSGAIAFRLVIAGQPYEWVSSSALIGASTDDRTRIGGLEARSIQWGESLDPATVKLRASGFTARIVEDGSHRTGDSFSRQPTRINYLSSSVSATAVSIPLTSTNTANGDIFFLGNECFKIVSGGGTAAPTVNSPRGYRDTIATAHTVDTTLGLTRPEVTFEETGFANGRATVEGSIAYLYAYGDGETGDGTLVWRGIVAAQPKLRDLTTWEVQLDSIASALNQSLNADLAEPSTLRGINYNAQTAPQFQISILSGADYDGAVQHTATVGGADLEGYYETQEDFCAALEALIRTASSTWGTHALNRTSGERPTLIPQPTTSGAWRFVYSTPSSSHRWCNVDTLNQSTARVDPVYSAGAPMLRLGDGVRVFAVTSSDSFEPYSFARVDAAGTVPRGFVGYLSAAVSTQTIYIGGSITLATGDSVALEWPAFDGRDALTRQYDVLTWDATTRRATLRVRRIPGPMPTALDRFYTASSVPTVTSSRTYAAEGTFADFLIALTTDSPTYAPSGRMPLVTGEHIDTSAITTTVDAVSLGRDWLRARTYAGASDVSLAKMVEDECKLYGLVPYITTDGRLAFREFRVGAATEGGSYSVDATNNLSGAQMPGWEPNAFGLVNTVQLKTGFDPLTSKHVGRTFVVRDAAALSRNPLPTMMKIEPRSTWAGDADIPYSEVLAMAQTWLGVLGGAYATITVACPLNAIDAVIGSQVDVTISQLPDVDAGARGLTNASGVVIGRKVKPLDATVELTLLSTYLRVAGYSPSLLVDTITLVSGASYDIAIDAVQPTGYGDLAFFATGDEIVVATYDQTTATSGGFTITAIDYLTQTITATLTVGAAPTGTCTVEFAAASAVVATQELYAYIALGAPDNFIPFASNNVPPRQLAS